VPPFGTVTEVKDCWSEISGNPIGTSKATFVKLPG